MCICTHTHMYTHHTRIHKHICKNASSYITHAKRRWRRRGELIESIHRGPKVNNVATAERKVFSAESIAQLQSDLRYEHKEGKELEMFMSHIS